MGMKGCEPHLADNQLSVLSFRSFFCHKGLMSNLWRFHWCKITRYLFDYQIYDAFFFIIFLKKPDVFY